LGFLLCASPNQRIVGNRPPPGEGEAKRLECPSMQAPKTRPCSRLLALLRESGHEHFNGSLVIPIINHGPVLELYSRKLRGDLRKGSTRRHSLRETDAQCR
jgi:hypothetical protein